MGTKEEQEAFERIPYTYRYYADHQPEAAQPETLDDARRALVRAGNYLQAVEADLNFAAVRGSPPDVVADIKARLPIARADRDRLADIVETLGPRRLRAFEDQRLPEERLFWLRRFHTSLGIGNAAAFAAVTSQVIKPEMATAAAAKTLAAAALWPMVCFAGGLVTAGLLPLLLALGARRAWPLAITSAVLFLGGILAAIDGVMGVAGLVWPWEAGW